MKEALNISLNLEKMPSVEKNNICNCGREIPHRFNSTIKAKLCPSCTYKEAVKSHRASPEGAGSIIKAKTSKVKLSKNNSFNLYQTTAWRWCSRYVLLFYADKNGFVQCSTSTELFYHVTDKRIQCGHYIKVKDGNSSNYATALEFKNLAPQSLRDNRYSSGKPEVMRQWLINKFGEEAIKNLEIQKFNVCKMDPFTLKFWAKLYKLRFKDLLKERNIKNPWK
jgi:hypothetical protein